MKLKSLVTTTLVSAKLLKQVKNKHNSSKNWQTTLFHKKMNEVDEQGLAHIHHAAKKGYFKSIEKFIKANEDQLEFETQDDLKETPLIVAVRAGTSNMETIKLLIELGANLAATNNFGYGLIEICCLEGHTGLLEHFVALNRPELPVWERILRFCASDSEEEAESAGKCLCWFTNPSKSAVNTYWKDIYNHGGVITLVKVVQGTVGDKAKEQALQCLINMSDEQQVRDQLVSSGGLESFIAQLKSPSNKLIKLFSTAIAILCNTKLYAEQASQKGAIAAIVNVIKMNNNNEVLVEAVHALGVICEGNDVRQSMFYTTPAGMQSLCYILENNVQPDILLSVCRCITKLVRRHENNQNSFVQSGGCMHIIMLTDIKSKDIQLAAIDTIHMLVEGNPYTQTAFKHEGVINPLTNVLNKSKSQTIQEKTASALWALAGEDGEERRYMASFMGVNVLIDFLGSLSEILHFIGSEGLGVLAQGAQNKQDIIAEGNGVSPLVRLLKSDKEYLVLSSIRSIRHLCVGVGYLPHRANQRTVAQSRGIKLLTALLTLSSNPLIQVESALTMAYVALGNTEVMAEIWASNQHLEFNYVKILKLLHSSDQSVRLLAGAALATFAFNNMAQQKLMAAEGGISFKCFIEFLQSEEEYLRCNAAFQIVVLARIIPDEEQAISSAAGIKLISDILHDSGNTAIQALAADCVARLAHTRAGVPHALVAIESVSRLCELMYSQNAQVRGCASIALSYLSLNHTAERQLLNRCRNDPYLMKCLKYYTQNYPLSKNFKKEWKHYKKVGSLPPIPEGRPRLVSECGFRTMVRESIVKLQKSPSKLDLIAMSPNRGPSRSAEEITRSSMSRLSRVSFQTKSMVE